MIEITERAQTMIHELNAEAARLGVPENIAQGMVSYIVLGVIPGGFCQAVIQNDLRGAISRADGWSLQRIKPIVDFMNMHAPAPCWGGEKELRAWRTSVIRKHMVEGS